MTNYNSQFVLIFRILNTPYRKHLNPDLTYKQVCFNIIEEVRL